MASDLALEQKENLANQLRGILSDEVSSVEPSSMESRPEPEYKFNEPLLENLLGSLSENHQELS